MTEEITLTEDNTQQESIKLIKGQRGNYGWEIKLLTKQGEMGLKDLDRLALIDAKLKEQYGALVDLA